MLAVFNWTNGTRSHSLRLKDFDLPATGTFKLYDSLHPNDPVHFAAGIVQLHDQQPHSVRFFNKGDRHFCSRNPTINGAESTIIAGGRDASELFGSVQSCRICRNCL